MRKSLSVHVLLPNNLPPVTKISGLDRRRNPVSSVLVLNATYEEIYLGPYSLYYHTHLITAVGGTIQTMVQVAGAGVDRCPPLR